MPALGNEQDRITGFTRGADDYLPKPFSLAELDARTDNQPVGFLYAFEVITAGGGSCQGNPATFILHVSTHLPVMVLRGVLIHALCA